MSKKYLWIANLITVITIPLIAHAANTLTFQGPQQTSPDSSAPVSPEEFANQVNAASAGQQAEFKNQLDQSVKALSTPTIPSISQVQTMAQTPLPTAPAPTAETKSSETPPQSVPPVSAPPPSAATTAPVVPTTPTQPSSPPPVLSTPPPAPAKQPDVYTGFPKQGSGNTTQQQGGFNIKY